MQVGRFDERRTRLLRVVGEGDVHKIGEMREMLSAVSAKERKALADSVLDKPGSFQCTVGQCRTDSDTVSLSASQGAVRPSRGPRREGDRVRARSSPDTLRLRLRVRGRVCIYVGLARRGAGRRR